MEDSEYNSLKPIMNYPFQNPQSSPSPQPPTQEKQIQNLDKAQTPKNEVSEKDTTKPPKENKITKIQKSLDEFIQGCLNKYKPVENPDPSLYANTTEQEKDLIISKKSTIPDLVIWNKNFNKNLSLIEPIVIPLKLLVNCFICVNPKSIPSLAYNLFII